MSSWSNELISGIVGVLITAIAFIVKLYLGQYAKKHKGPLVIGIIGNTPPELYALPDFTDLKKARQSRCSFVLLHTRNASYALRVCDFVYGVTNDPKVLVLEDLRWLLTSESKKTSHEEENEV